MSNTKKPLTIGEGFTIDSWSIIFRIQDRTKIMLCKIMNCKNKNRPSCLERSFQKNQTNIFLRGVKNMFRYILHRYFLKSTNYKYLYLRRWYVLVSTPYFPTQRFMFFLLLGCCAVFKSLAQSERGRAGQKVRKLLCVLFKTAQNSSIQATKKA